MDGDEWTVPSRSGAELAKIRLAVVADIGERDFTCDGCGAASTCALAFDPYNTDGDCLMEK